MPSIENIDQFKSIVQSLGDEPQIRAQLGLAMDEIKPPESKLPDDLADLLGGQPAAESVEEADSEAGGGELEALLAESFAGGEPEQGPVTEDSPEPEAGFLDDLLGQEPPAAATDMPVDLDALLAGPLEGSSPAASEPEASPPTEEGPLDLDMDKIMASLDDLAPPEEAPGAGEEIEEAEEAVEVLEDAGLGASDLTGAGLAGEDQVTAQMGSSTSMDFGVEASDYDFSAAEPAEEKEDEFLFDDSGTLDNEIPELRGFAAREEDVEAFDATQEADEFQLGDFSSQFGITDEEETGASTSAADEIEGELPLAPRELTLTDEEFRSLQSHLGLMPLNLKLAIEELIGEKDVAFDDLEKVVRMLLSGASPRALASAVSKILGRTIKVTAGFMKGLGAELEGLQASVSYQVRKVMWPIVRLFLAAAAVAAVLIALGWNFIYHPLSADGLYREGQRKILEGDPLAAEGLFATAYKRWPSDEWFFKYAESYLDMGEYEYARRKYRQILKPARDASPDSPSEGQEIFLNFNRKALMDYSAMERDFGFDGKDPEAHFMEAHRLLKTILDRQPGDRDAILAEGDLFLKWALDRSDFTRMEQANRSYSDYLQRSGYDGAIVFRFLKYFMIQDANNPTPEVEKEILRLKRMSMESRSLEMPPLLAAQVAGWLIDKDASRLAKEARKEIRQRTIEEEYGLRPAAAQTPAPEEGHGPPLDPRYTDQPARTNYWEDVRPLLEKAIARDFELPETHYELSRYFRYLDERGEEKKALGTADIQFNALSPRELRKPERLRPRLRTLVRIGEIFAAEGQPLSAEKYFLEAQKRYEAALEQRLIQPESEFGSIYARLADIYYLESASWDEALRLFEKAQATGLSSLDITFKKGVIQYRQKRYSQAVREFFEVEHAPERPDLRTQPNVLYAMGNTLYKSGNHFGAQGYYQELLERLEQARTRIRELDVVGQPRHRALVEMLMKTTNNLAAALLSDGTGAHSAEASALLVRSDTLYRDLTRLVSDYENTVNRSLASVNLRSRADSRGLQTVEIYPDLPWTLEQYGF